MKKLLFAVLVLTLVVSFTSCRDKKERDRVEHRVEKVKKISMMRPTRCLTKFKTVRML